MNAVERLRAAIERLEARKATSTQGPWVAEYSGEQGNCVIPADAQSTREAVAVTRLYYAAGDADLIVTLHRTIDAQIALLRGWATPNLARSAPAALLDLADAILGES